MTDSGLFWPANKVGFIVDESHSTETIHYVYPAQHISTSLRSALRIAKRSERRGAAAIETALLLPVLILLAFGSIELSNMVFLRQSLSIAAYEGARIATKPGATAEQANTRVREVLNARGITSYTVSYTTTNNLPITVTSLTTRGTQLSVIVQSSNGGANYGPLRMFTAETFSVQPRWCVNSRFQTKE